MHIFNAAQIIDELFELDRRLAERVLDTISENPKNKDASGTWDRDENGNMILLTYAEAEEQEINYA